MTDLQFDQLITILESIKIIIIVGLCFVGGICVGTVMGKIMEWIESW